MGDKIKGAAQQPLEPLDNLLMFSSFYGQEHLTKSHRK